MLKYFYYIHYHYSYEGGFFQSSHVLGVKKRIRSFSDIKQIVEIIIKQRGGRIIEGNMVITGWKLLRIEMSEGLKAILYGGLCVLILYLSTYFIEIR